MNVRRPARGMAVAVLALASPAAPAAAGVSVSAAPELFPAYSRDQTDYVTRCDGQVTLAVTTTSGERVAIERLRPRSGRFTQGLPLRAGQSITFRVTGGGARTLHHVRCLPADFPRWQVHRTGETEAAYHVVGLGSYVIAFDAEGVPAWWYRTGTVPLDAKLLPNGNFAYARYAGGPFGTAPDLAYEERAPDGRLVRTLATHGTPTDHHDLQVLRDGRYLLLSYRRRDGVDLSAFGKPAASSVYDAELQAVTADGRPTWSWNSADHIGAEESDRWWPYLGAAGPFDHVHANSVDEAADGDLIVSARHLDAVYRIDPHTGSIVWKLGGTSTPRSLAVEPAGELPTGGQHDARELPDGTITVFDNRAGLPGPPRAARYAIDAAAGTARLVESVTDPAVVSSYCCGSARRLPGGHWVVAWGGLPLITEQDGAGATVLRLEFSAAGGLGFSYRDNPVLHGVLRRSALRAAMDSMHPRRAIRNSDSTSS